MTFQELKHVARAASKRIWQSAPQRALIAIGVLFTLPVFGVLTAFGVASDTQIEAIPRQDVIETLSLPAFNEADQHEHEFHFSERIQRGDSVASLLQRLSINDVRAFNYLRTEPGARSIFQLRPGRQVRAVVSGDGELQSLRYLHSSDKFLEVRRVDDKFMAYEQVLTPQRHAVQRSGVIRSSLYGATDEAGIPDAIANQLARIFSTDIDFHVDLRKGDRFSVIYESRYFEGEYLGPGRVLSAEFTNAGKKFEAYLFTDSEGNDGYYGANGQNRAKSFLRSPLEFSRVSSGFGGRVHPIMKNWRAHNGVDFAAPKGTPVWATADGMVDFVGVKGGYGNVVEIRHSNGVTTLYAHLSRFADGVRAGTRVSQGQNIGYVGATGWATGPHLHYEFKIANVHQDPLKVALPKADPIAPQYRDQFMKQAGAHAAQLALVRDLTFSRFE
jgi:murein DD-endopeptidase MepM/ murein hydrolase activator NlpD